MQAVLELLSSGVWLAVACSLEKKHDVAFVTKLAFDSAHAILVKVNPRIIQSLVRLFSIRRQHADPVCFFHLVGLSPGGIKTQHSPSMGDMSNTMQEAISYSWFATYSQTLQRIQCEENFCGAPFPD